MNSIFRANLPLRVASSSIAPRHRFGSVYSLSRRSYAQSSYGAEGETRPEQPNNPRNSPTRDIEHPGPPPPDVGKGSSSSSSGSQSESSSKSASSDSKGEDQGQPIPRVPSNKAKPTITDGRQSPNVDDDGEVRSDVPKDVKQHNKDMANRYDRSYNQIADEGKIKGGFGEGN